MNTRNHDFRDTVNTFLGKAKRLAGKIRHDFEVEFGAPKKHAKHRRGSKQKTASPNEIHKMGDKVEHAAD